MLSKLHIPSQDFLEDHQGHKTIKRKSLQWVKFQIRHIMKVPRAALYGLCADLLLLAIVYWAWDRQKSAQESYCRTTHGKAWWIWYHIRQKFSCQNAYFSATRDWESLIHHLARFLAHSPRWLHWEPHGNALEQQYPDLYRPLALLQSPAI